MNIGHIAEARGQEVTVSWEDKQVFNEYSCTLIRCPLTLLAQSRSHTVSSLNLEVAGPPIADWRNGQKGH